MNITEHAYDRAKERMGLSKKALERHMEKVFEHGRMHGEFSGPMKRYLDAEFLSHCRATAMRVYGHFLYLIAQDGTLITIVEVPRKYHGILDKGNGV